MDKQFIEDRKRKLKLMLPVLVLPFLTLLFYSLGGGKGATTTEAPRSNALSFTLPDPLIEDKPTDKLSLYRQAEKDSLNRLRAAQYDPFAPWMPKDENESLLSASEYPLADISPYTYSAPLTSTGIQTSETKRKTTEDLEQKMVALQKLLETSDTSLAYDDSGQYNSSENTDADLQRLEAMMQSLAGSQDTEQDAVLTQASDVLEKILDVQHPSRVMDRLREQSEQNKGNVYAVSTEPEKEVSDLIEIPFDDGTPANSSDVQYSIARFYDDEQASDAGSQNAISAVVHEDQTLVSGATIKLRLEQNAFVRGQLITKGSFVYGKCALNGERLLVDISSIRHRNSIFPVSLAVYDMDGLAGLRIPGSINRDASKEGTEQMVQALSIGSLNPSLGAQATSAGIDIAKNLLTRKVRLIRISVKAGYPLLLANPSAR